MGFFLNKIIPPKEWRLAYSIILGISMGLILYISMASNVVSYLSDKPETCINCHVMNPEYASWQHSSHRENATCNDCHVPQDNFVSKYYFKATDGLRHATIFTLRAEPQVIRILDAGKEVVQKNCLRCHSNLVANVKIKDVMYKEVQHGEGKLCWECHREVPHGRVRSLSASPNAIVPVVKTDFSLD